MCIRDRAEGKKAQAGDGQAEGKKTQAARKEPAKKDAAKKEPAKKEAAKKDAGKRENASKREPGRETRPAAKPQNQNQNRPAKAKSAPKGDGKGKLKIIPLGGLEQIGMNITAFEYEDTIIVVDCGLAFPGDDMLGIDLVIPDVKMCIRDRPPFPPVPPERLRRHLKADEPPL